MRTIFTLLIGITTFTAKAADEGRLTVTFAGVNAMVVQVDNRYYAMNANTVCIDPISAGRHTVKIYQPSNGSNVRGTLMVTNQVLIRPYTHVDVMFNRFGRALVDERRISTVTYNNFDVWGNSQCMDGQDWSESDWNNSGWGNGGNWGHNGGNGNNGGWNNGGGNGNNGGWNNGNGNGGNNGGNGGNNGNGGWSGAAMSASNFTALLGQLHAETFDNTKLTIVKDALASNKVNVAQVKQLMQQFSFDNDKLEVAKTAYPRCTEKNNYFQVSDAFEFSNSKEQLSAWVRTQN